MRVIILYQECIVSAELGDARCYYCIYGVNSNCRGSAGLIPYPICA